MKTYTFFILSFRKPIFISFFRLLSINSKQVINHSLNSVNGIKGMSYQHFRNSLIMLLKNLPANKVWWLIPFRHLLDTMSSVFFLLNGFPKHSLAIHKAHFHFARYFFKWLKLRRKTQATIKNTQLLGVYEQSVVWRHFIEKKQTFNEL